MTALLIALIPIAAAGGFLVGVNYGVKATRTTDGRHRFSAHTASSSTPKKGGQVVMGPQQPRPQTQDHIPPAPPTVGIPKIDGSMPMRSHERPRTAVLPAAR